MKKATEAEPCLTIPEVSEVLRCSEKTVRRAIEAGLLKAIRIGPGAKLIRVRVSDHEAYRTRASQ